MNYKTIVLLLVGIGILAAMVLYIGPGQIESAWKTANPWYVALAVAIQFIIYAMWNQRWAITIHSLQISIKKRHIFPMLMVGLAVNNITPSARGGGEPIRAYMLGKYTKAPMENAFATVIADRGLDTFPFVVLAILTIIFSVLYFNLPEWVVLALIISLVALVIVFILVMYMSINNAAGEKITLWIVGLVKRFSKRKHFEIERRAIEAMRGFQGQHEGHDKGQTGFDVRASTILFSMVYGNNTGLYSIFSLWHTSTPWNHCSGFCNSNTNGTDPASSRRCRCS